MEDRVVKLETKIDFFEKEIKEIKNIHKEEISELKKTFKNFQISLEKIQEEIRIFRQTHIQIKYLIIGGALVVIAKEIGLTHFFKFLLGVL